jgi:hypothetical protein
VHTLLFELLDVRRRLRPLTNLMDVSCGFKGVFSSARGQLRLDISGESWNVSNEITNAMEKDP